METKVYLLDGGSLALDKSFMLWNHGQGEEVRFPVYSVLVVHPEAKILFDTGFDLETVQRLLPFEKPEQTEEQTIPGQLKKIGLSVNDIDYVVNSHLHFDHCGANPLFPHATFVVHKEELRNAYVPEPFAKIGYVREHFDIKDAKYELITGDYELVDGVHLIHTPGHTSGHYSLFVENLKQPVIYTADAIFGEENLEKLHPMGLHTDPSAMVDSMVRLKKLAQKKKAIMLFSHEFDSFLKYKKAPLFY